MSSRKHLTCALAVLVLAGTLKSAASGRITAVVPTGTNLVVTIETAVGIAYQVQCRPNLLSGEWANEGEPFVAEAETTQRSVPVTEDHCYLRVVQVEQGGESEPSDPALPPPPPPPPPPA